MGIHPQDEAEAGCKLGGARLNLTQMGIRKMISHNWEGQVHLNPAVAMTTAGTGRVPALNLTQMGIHKIRLMLAASQDEPRSISHKWAPES